MIKIKDFCIIYSIAFVLILPCLLVTSERVSGMLFGLAYITVLACLLALTRLGRMYMKAFYYCTVRLEIFALGKCCDAK